MLFIRSFCLWTYVTYCFFFKESATTGSYTYGHPLSLHDALPIFLENEAVLGTYQPHRVDGGDLWRRVRVPEGDPVHDYFPPIIDEATFLRARVRSEEHTSELQSLMRNSYAVFCLKKKIKLAHYSDQDHIVHNISHPLLA